MEKGEWSGLGSKARILCLCRLLGGVGGLLEEGKGEVIYEFFARMLKWEHEGGGGGWGAKADLCVGLGVGVSAGKVRGEVVGLVVGVCVGGVREGKKLEEGLMVKFLRALELACKGGEEETLGLCVMLLEALEGGEARGMDGLEKRQCLLTVSAILVAYKGDHESAALLKQSVASMAAQAREWDVWKAVGGGLDELVTEALVEGVVSIKDVAEGMDVEVLMRALGGVILGGFLKEGCSKGGRGKSMEFLRYLLLAYKGCAADGSKLESFFGILLPVFVQVLEFNGLPNGYMQGVGGVAGDVVLGKTLAGVMLNFVKSSGAAFKNVMGKMGERERSLLEKSVRGEMTGYSGGAGGGAGVPQKLVRLTLKKAS